jgi:hypothetical protein
VEYVIKNSSPSSRPYFDLHDFQNKSFVVSGGANREYITLEGSRTSHGMPPGAVSHTFKNVNIKLANSGYYLFNNAVFANVTISRLRKSEEYAVMQRGMTTDMRSLWQFYWRDLLGPCSLYMLVDGGDRLNEAIIHSNNSITLIGDVGKEKREIPIDLSRLTRPLTLATEEEPFSFNCDTSDSVFSHPLMPRLRIDLSNVRGADTYIMLAGKTWTSSSHNLNQYISVYIYRGQLSILVEGANDTDGMFVGQPSHVHLDGNGDFYITGLTQFSPFYSGQHDEARSDVDWSGLIVFLFVAVTAGLLGVLLCGFRPAAQPPETGRIRERDPQPEQEVYGSSQFPTVENVGESKSSSTSRFG